MKKAWIENSRIRDVVAGNPADMFHSAIAAHYTTDVPDDAAPGDGWVSGALVKPTAAVVASIAPPVPKVSPVEFKLLFTPQERVAIKAARATDVVVDDFFDIVDDPRLTFVDLGLTSTQQALQYLASLNLIQSSRVAQILAGTFI